MLLGSVLNPINSTIIAVTLVPIGDALGAPPSQTAWLVSALYLATALGQPVVGRLIDIFGPRRLFLVSTSLVGVAGVAGTLAPDLGVLIASRVLLGFGTCAGYPAAMALLRSEARRTGRDSPGGVLTALAVANQTIAVIGPLLGGLLIGLGGWRATFALNVPLAVAPWNSPVILSVRSFAPALAAGCTVVLKLPGRTALTNNLLYEIVDATASLPKGVFNAFTESGSTGARLIVADPGVDDISYTGSTGVGRGIMADAAST